MKEDYQDFLKTLTTCPFCERSHNRVLLECEHTYLTYALAPYHKHHLLVVPRRHVLSITELTSEEEEEISQLQRIGLAVLNKLGYESVTFMVREGKVEKNKSIDHTHFHVVPYVQIGDVDHFGEPRRVLSDDEIIQTVNELRRVLPE